MSDILYFLAVKTIGTAFNILRIFLALYLYTEGAEIIYYTKNNNYCLWCKHNISSSYFLSINVL